MQGKIAVFKKHAGILPDLAPHRLIGIIPASLSPGAWKLEIVTQYSSGSFSLKEPRIISFGPALTVPEADS